MLFGKAKKEAPSKVAPSLGGKNGSTPRPSTATQEKKPFTRPRDARQARFAQSFAHVVAVLMRDRNFRNLRIGDLEWLVLPPIMAGQCKLGHAARPADDKARQPGIRVPVAVVLWARVSSGIDKAFSEQLDKPMQLQLDQWASGDKLWVMAAAGERRAVPHLLKELQESEFKGQRAKMRTLGSDGKVVVKVLEGDAK